MNTAHFSRKAITFFILTALLAVATGVASAAAPTITLSVDNLSPALSAPSNLVTTINVTSSDSSNQITFTVPVQPATNWLSISPTGTVTTPATLTLSVKNNQNTSTPVGFTLTATAPAAAVGSTATVTATYSAAGGGTGGTVNPTSFTMNAALGGVATTAVLTVTTTGAVPVLTPGATWLTAPLASSGSNIYSYTVTANPSNLVATTYSTNLQVSVGGVVTNVPVTFFVGGSGTGTLGVYPSNSVALSYNSGGVAVPSQTVTVQNVGYTASSYSATPSSSGSWLLVAQSSNTPTASAVYSIPFSFGSSTLTIAANPAGLGTGSYTGYIYLSATDGSSATITVTLTVNGGSSGGLVTPNPVYLTAPVGGSTQSQILTVAGSASYAQVTNQTTTSGGSWLQAYGLDSTRVQVYAYPTGLSAGTYYGSFTVNSVTAVQVVFTVGSGGGGTGSASGIAPTSLSYYYQRGGGAFTYTINPQYITVAGPAGGQFTASVTAGNSWLIIDKIQGDTPNTITVTIVQAPLALGLNSGSIQITPPGGTAVTIPVTVTVVGSAVAIAQPGSINVSWNNGDANPSRTLYLYTSDSTSLSFTASGSASWINVAPVSGTISGAGTPVTVTLNPTGLATGVYSGNVSVTSSGTANSPFLVPVVLTVNGGTGTSTGPLTLNPGSLAFSVQTNTTAALNLGVTASVQTYFTAAATTTSGGSWLSVTPTVGYATTTQTNLSVAVNTTGLATGATYNGTISLTSNGIIQTVPVTLYVGTGGGGGSGNITVTPTALTFNYSVGEATPGVQGLSLTATAGGNVGFTMAATTTSGGSWLTVPSGQLSTPMVASVSVNVAGLTPATYSGTITITPTGGTAVTIPVSLVIQGLPTVSATPSSLSFSYRLGDANPAAQTITVAGGSSTLTFSATPASTGGWLSVTPTTGSTPGTVSVSVDGSKLSTGTQSGTVTVAGTGGATGSTTITVTVIVTAPLPTVTSIKNGASFQGTGVAPGEIVSLFGTFIGPATPAVATLDSTGKVSTTLSGVQVLFNGVAAPLAYVSATQINAVVPYELAGRVETSVWVSYRGQTSNSVPLPVVTTAPGIYTLNQSGSGPGAIFNQDYTYNGSSNPALKGATVMIFATGEGQTNPFGVTGKVNPVVLKDLPVPLLPVAVTVDGQPANYSFAGGAPGWVSGLLQINVQIPLNVRTGDVPLAVTIGSNSSQANVTVSVR